MTRRRSARVLRALSAAALLDAAFSAATAAQAQPAEPGALRSVPSLSSAPSALAPVPFFRVKDRYESWIDVATLASLRYRQQIHEGRYKRSTTYEIYPERAAYQKNGDSAQASVASPLDDGSFLYAVRVAGVRVGEARRDDRYFKPDRNPVVLTGVRRDTVTVPAGTFATTVVRPTIRAKGIFSEDGEAQVWFSDDAARYPVQVKTRFATLSLTLTLQSVARGVDASALPGLLAAAAIP